MSDSEDDRQQQGSNEQRQRQQQQEESEMRSGGEAEIGPTHNRLNMSCPTAKMTGSSKVDDVWLLLAKQVR